jgi:hypothetical protein
MFFGDDVSRIFRYSRLRKMLLMAKLFQEIGIAAAEW